MRVTLDIPETIDMRIIDGKTIIDDEIVKLINNFVRAKQQMDKVEEQLSDVIASAINNLDPDITIIRSDDFRIQFRRFGSRWDFIQDSVEEKYLINKKSLNTKEVDAFFKKNGQLPPGVFDRDGEKKVSITAL